MNNTALKEHLKQQIKKGVIVLSRVSKQSSWTQIEIGDLDFSPGLNREFCIVHQIEIYYPEELTYNKKSQSWIGSV